MPVIVLAGLAQAVRTWAWRLTLLDARRRPSFGRMFGLRLASEAAGQVGVFGQVFGDTWRVAGLGADLPIAARITSVALDRALYTLSSTIVTFAGVVALAFVLPLPGKIALYAKVFGFVLVAIVSLAVIAVRRRWPLISGLAAALAHIGRIRPWVESKRAAIQSVEDRLLDFFHHSPGAFRGNLVLQMAGQVAAVLEVYLVLRLMGHAVGFSSALAIEGLTKLVNVMGMINPGNAGTYEGGNMLFAKLVGVTGTAGLTLALIRRVRALFWTAVGAVCAVMLPGSARRENRKVQDNADPAGHGYTAVILAQLTPAHALLTRVGALPVLLRAILGARKAGAGRIAVVVDRAAALLVREELRRTRRLPDDVEWHVPDAGETAPALRDLADGEERLVLIAADRTYHPSLHRRAAEWDGTKVLALTTDSQPAGMFAFTTPSAVALLKACPAGMRTLEELHAWLAAAEGLVCESVPSDQWQRVLTEEDRLLAEQKLDKWLVKPTDGVFARMNRKVSIPISRQLIKFPITPNMVSLFTLGVSFSAGAFFALGGHAEHVARRDSVGFRQHSGRLRRRGGPAHVPGLGVRLLVGNGLRLPVLRLHLRRDDDWGAGQRSDLLDLGNPALCGRGCHHADDGAAEAQNGRGPPGAVSEPVASAGVQTTLQSVSVPRPPHGVPDPPLLHALSGPCVRTVRCDLHGIYRRRRRGEHRLADSPVLIFHLQPRSNAQ